MIFTENISSKNNDRIKYAVKLRDKDSFRRTEGLFFLEGARYIAKLFHLSDAVIGLTVVAVGTSLPELATSVVAAIKKEQDIAIGNVVGSNIFNILGIIGITPMCSPLSNYSINAVDLGMMLLCTIGLLPLMRTNWKISRAEGFLMLAVYCAYTAYLIVNHT